MNLRKYFIRAADDDQDQAQNNQPDDDDNQSSMQTLTDGTAQALCLRLWKGYVSDDLTNFNAFMMQVDQVVTSFVQALPVAIDPQDLEDSAYDDSEFSLPSIGPTGEDANEE